MLQVFRKETSRKSKWILLLLLACPALASAQGKLSEKSSPLLELDQLSESVQALTERVSPSVVRISVAGYEVKGPTNQTEYAAGRQQIIGSGVIVDPTGYIMTNAHVVEGAHKIMVNLVPRGQQNIHAVLAESFAHPQAATLVGVFKEGDLALIKVNGSGLPALAFANYTQLRQGQVVFALGSPAGLQNSISMGVVSSIARQPNPDSPFLYIQTDTPINPGNSGGPLINTRGEIVGLNTFILSESGGNEGISFAIPSMLVQWVYKQLRQHGHVDRATVGIGVQAITPLLSSALGLHRSSGVLVTDVTPGTPADAAGVHVNDVLLGIDGHPVDAVPAMLALFFQHAPGDRVSLKLLRGDQEMTMELTTVEQPHRADQLIDLANTDDDSIPELGIVGVTTDKRVEQILGPLRLPLGVVVAIRMATASGVETGLQTSDVIHSVNGNFVRSVAELRSAVQAIKPGEPIALLIERGGQLQYLAFTLE